MSANSTLFPKKIARLIDDACARARWLPPWLAKSSFGARHAAVRLHARCEHRWLIRYIHTTGASMFFAVV